MRQAADLLQKISRIQPDGFFRESAADFSDQLPDLLPVIRMERVSAAQGNAGYIILLQLSEQLLPGRLIKGNSPLDILGNGIVALRKAMRAARHPQHSPQSLPVEHIILGNIVIAHLP